VNLLLLINDTFEWRKSVWRFLKTNDSVAYVIDTQCTRAEPRRVNVNELLGIPPKRNPVTPVTEPRKVSAKSKEFLDKKWTREKPLFDSIDLLLDCDTRARLIPELAAQIGCAPATLETSCRRYWQRGQTKSALLPDYYNSGRHDGGTTAKRGRRPSKENEYAIYQLEQVDHDLIRKVIDEVYLRKDSCATAVDAYDHLIDNHYQYLDGNGESFERPLGERPTLRQFRHILKKLVPKEVRIRRREGDRSFVRDHAPALEDTIRDCLGVGHKYEIDASIADVLIVSQFDRSKVIGKATIYFIIDRRSRLIVGFYVGLETASWDTALEAILSIFEDKQALCTRYGVEYNPRDWPAHCVMSQNFVADHAELFSRYSDALTEHFNVTMENPTAEAPNFKPNVETQFARIKVTFRTSPGFDPPEKKGMRRKKNYAKDAALTLFELVKHVLEAVIAHNRAPLANDLRKPDQVLRKVEKSPIGLWNDGMTQRSGKGRHYDYAEVMQYLLPTDTATVSRTEIKFKSLYYTSDDPILRRILVDLGDRREKLKVSFDRRCVDIIWIWTSDSRAVPAVLAGMSADYSGLSFAEVAYIEKVRAQQQPHFDQMARDVKGEQRKRKNTLDAAARAHQAKLGRQSVNSRTVDTVHTRAVEKAHERRELSERRAKAHGLTPPCDNVVGMPVAPSTSKDADSTANTELSPIQRARMRMMK
jgi:putative transposase